MLQANILSLQGKAAQALAKMDVAKRFLPAGASVAMPFMECEMKHGQVP